MNGDQAAGPADTGVTWAVGKQSHTTQFVDGVGVPGVNVPVVLSTGETFTLFVPVDVYAEGADRVRQVIQADVDRHMAVAGLTGTAG